MDIKILYDNYAFGKNILKGWGFSCLVDNSVLFDTGEDGVRLLSNMKEMGVSLDKLKAVVISHDHWDHTGGLGEILKQKKGLKVYGCPGFGATLKDNIKELQGALTESEKPREIKNNVFVTGEISGVYKGEYIGEQALVLKTEKGVSVITGCSHPGIVKILNTVKNKFAVKNFYFVGGGFHLKSSSENDVEAIVKVFKELRVKKIGPTHCSGDEAKEIFSKNFGENCINVTAGKTFEV